jgi:hypothetical protein
LRNEKGVRGSQLMSLLGHGKRKVDIMFRGITLSINPTGAHHHFAGRVSDIEMYLGGIGGFRLVGVRVKRC